MPSLVAPAPLRGLVRRRDELLTRTRRALLERFDDPVGDQCRERVPATEIQPELVEQRNRIRREPAASRSNDEPESAPADEPAPLQPFAQLFKQGLIAYAGS